jgi:hypothetical protein
MKKNKFLVPLLILLVYFVIGTITTGCSEYTCPTYSNVYNIKSQQSNKMKKKMMANYYHTKKFRY